MPNLVRLNANHIYDQTNEDDVALLSGQLPVPTASEGVSEKYSVNWPSGRR